MTVPLTLLPTDNIDGDIVNLVDALADEQDRLTQLTIAIVLARLALMTNDDWYDHVRITELVERIAPHIKAAQRRVAQLTDAYLTRTLTTILGSRVRPVGTVDVDDLRIGVRHDQVYGRLADNYRYLRSIGVEPQEAASRVSTRARTMVDTDNLLAMRAQAEKTLRDRREVLGYRRIIHPELSREGSCGLCIVAADRVYSKKNLLPIHDKCKCTVLPVVRIGDQISDPGLTLNREDLNAIYEKGGGNTRQKLSKVRLREVVHGELGPVLTYRGQHFRTASDVKRAA